MSTVHETLAGIAFDLRVESEKTIRYLERDADGRSPAALSRWLYDRSKRLELLAASLQRLAREVRS